MTIHLSRDREQFVHSLVGEGRYTSESEVVEAALRLLERTHTGQAEHARRIEALLIEGLESGPSTPMTANDWDEVEREGERLIAARKVR
jgi:antitoxin ParD1/3/4